MFRPPGLLATQVAPTAVIHRSVGSRGVSIRACHASLPPHAPDMLAARMGNWRPGTVTPSDSRSCRLLLPTAAWRISLKAVLVSRLRCSGGQRRLFQPRSSALARRPVQRGGTISRTVKEYFFSSSISIRRRPPPAEPAPGPSARGREPPRHKLFEPRTWALTGAVERRRRTSLLRETEGIVDMRGGSAPTVAALPQVPESPTPRARMPNLPTG